MTTQVRMDSGAPAYNLSGLLETTCCTAPFDHPLAHLNSASSGRCLSPTGPARRVAAQGHTRCTGRVFAALACPRVRVKNHTYV